VMQMPSGGIQSHLKSRPEGHERALKKYHIRVPGVLEGSNGVSRRAVKCSNKMIKIAGGNVESH
jgi:hypothetical protein